MLQSVLCKDRTIPKSTREAQRLQSSLCAYRHYFENNFHNKSSPKQVQYSAEITPVVCSLNAGNSRGGGGGEGFKSSGNLGGRGDLDLKVLPQGSTF